MDLVKYSNQFPSIFDRFFDTDIWNWSNRNFSNTDTTLPSVNVKESKDDFTVEVAAPGFEKGDFNIELNNDVLTISSEKKTESKNEDDERLTRREFSYQSFSRSFTLPGIVEREKIKAKYDKGILNIVIPKKEEAKPKPAKRIAIS
ncbi:MAG: Hsp20/alpha crystallin family protein [Melioribacteraceae bacterium]|nr:Hsp20/alpha crystallin family protein [Melioribacteraceae bacterium]